MSAWTKRIAAEDPERYRAWLDSRNAKTATQTREQKDRRNELERARYARRTPGARNKAAKKRFKTYENGIDFAPFKIPEDEIEAWNRARERWL